MNAPNCSAATLCPQSNERSQAENDLLAGPTQATLRLVMGRLTPLTLLAASLCVGLPFVRAQDTAKVDAAKQAERFAPSPEVARPVERIDNKRDDRVQDARAALAGLIDEPTAPIADRRAPVDISETREKTIVERKDAPLATTPLQRKDSALNGQTARDQFQSATGTYRNAGAVAEKYQQGLREAESARSRLQPDLGRLTTFDRLNRFVYKRNGPGTEGGAALVTAAGGGSATALPTSGGPAGEGPLPIVGASGGIGLMGVGFPAERPPPANKVVPIPAK